MGEYHYEIGQAAGLEIDS